jgi:putative CocE/NonD family hydrolase
MRDGVDLSVTLYLPAGPVGRHPAILTMTPYIADSYHAAGMWFAERGFAFVIADVRGRGNSAGEFKPSTQESRDGYDLVEHIAQESWCDGRVAMWGGSYGGYTQWATARGAPSSLRAIVPIAAPFRGVDSPMRCHIFSTERMQWLLYTAGNALQARLFSDEIFWNERYRAWHESGTSFRSLDTFIGVRSPQFQEWLNHPDYDDYWASQNPSDEEYAGIDLPILSITGAYDDDQPGTHEHYRRHMRLGTPHAKARHFLVIGPWDHAGTRNPVTSFGGLVVGTASLVDISALHLEWYRWALGEGAFPSFLKQRVTYYLAQADEWRYAASLEAVTAERRGLYLSSRVNADSIETAGVLCASTLSSGADYYVFDPRVTDGPEVDAEIRIPRNAIAGPGLAIALSGRQLVYETEEFDADLDIAGFFRLSAWISIDCPDTDFYVTIYEVAADGSCVRLSTDAMRARYRSSDAVPELIETNDPLLYDFDHFTFVARRVLRGARLRLVIAPMGRLIETVFTQKNYNGGGVVADETAADGRPVTVTLHYGIDFPSRLYLPIAAVEEVAQ